MNGLFVGGGDLWFARALLIAHSSTSGVLVQGLDSPGRDGGRGVSLLQCPSKMLSLGFLRHRWDS